MTNQFINIETIDAYNRSFNLSNRIWSVVIKWDNFEKFGVGSQLTRAADSISANLAEGFGRYHKKDKIKFFRYSFGSLLETIDWIKKAKTRALIDEEQYLSFMSELDKLPLEINQLIKYTNIKLKY